MPQSQHSSIWIRRAIHAALAATTAGAITAVPAIAQDESAAGLEEVVVTARKRAESLQDVPVAVTALTAGMIERGNLNTVVDVAKMAPNVELIAQPFAGSALAASIRGVGLDDLEKTFEPTVAVSVDGVFYSSTAGANVDLFDVEAIEVLRGPQGTLFGRNTIGGVINIQRSKPTGEAGMRLQATFDEFERQDFKAVINAPLGADGGIKVSLRSLQSESFAKNVTKGENPDNRDLVTASVAVRYNFSDDWSAQFTWDNYNDNTQLVDLLNISTTGGPNFEGANGFALISPFHGKAESADRSRATDYTTTYSSGNFMSTIQGNNYALAIDGRIGNHDLKFITSMMDTKERMDICSWGSPIPGIIFPFGTGTPDNPSDAPCLFPVLREQEFEQSSNEIQITSDFDGPINYVAGIYTMESEAPFESGPVQVIESLQDLEARAIYGEINWDITDAWELTVGARYTEEEKDFFVVAGGFPNGKDFNFEDDEVTYRLVLQRNFDFGMIYGSYSTGFKSGGFNSRGTTDNTVGPYASETVDSMEIGFRSEWFDNRLTFNATYFDASYEDKQEQVVTAGDGSYIYNGQPENCGGPTCTFIFNAGEVDTDGLELEVMAMVTDRLTLRGAMGTLDADYARFDYAGIGDISDRAEVVWAPELTYNIGGEYRINGLGGEWIINANYKYTDEAWGRSDFGTYNFQYGPEILREDFKVLDVSATYLLPVGNGTAMIRVYGTDILEDGGRIERPFDAGAFAFASLVPRRTLGVTIGYEF